MSSLPCTRAETGTDLPVPEVLVHLSGSVNKTKINHVVNRKKKACAKIDKV